MGASLCKLIVAQTRDLSAFAVTRQQPLTLKPNHRMNSSYYEGLQKCVGLYLEDGKYSADQFKWSSAVKRIPLDFLQGDKFREAAESYIRPLLTKGVPSLFSDLSSLYNHPGKNGNHQEQREAELPPGMDGSHWLVVYELPPEIQAQPVESQLNYYLNLLELYLGSRDEALKRLYSISHQTYVGFGAILSEETVQQLKGQDEVVLVIPDIYVNIHHKLYGGIPIKHGKISLEDQVKMEMDLDDFEQNQQKKQLKQAELEACKGSENALKFHATRWSDID